MSEMKRNAELLEMVDGLQKEIVKLESHLEMCEDIRSLQGAELEDAEAVIAIYVTRYGELRY
jgi:hypothetical protein